MAALDIYIDCDRATAVTSQQNSSPKALPRFVQGDTLSLRIHLLKGFNAIGTDYEVIPTTGIALKVAVGVWPPVGNEDPPEYYTQNLTGWTESEDLTCFEGTLPFNTEAVDELLGASDKAFAALHIYRTESGYPNTVLLEKITIWSSTIKEGGIVTPAEPTPLSVDVGNTLYLPKEGVDELIFIDRTTGDKLRLWFADGILKQEVISA